MDTMRRTGRGALAIALAMVAPTGTHAAEVSPSRSTTTAAQPTMPVPPAGQEEAVDALLASARLWLSLERPDTARRVLHKILAAQADHAQALLLLAELELRSGQGAAADKALTALARRHGGSAEQQEAAAQQRLYTRDKGRLSQLRLARQGGQTEVALRLARELFRDGIPPGELLAELAPLLATAPGGFERMTAQLSQRVQRHRDPRDRFALAGLWAQREATLPQALRLYAELAQRQEVDAARLAGPWRSAIERAGARGRTGQAQYRTFYAHDPRAIERLAAAPNEPRARTPGRGSGRAISIPPARPSATPAGDAVALLLAQAREQEVSAPGQASALYGEAINRFPNDRAAWRARTAWLFRQGQVDVALDELRQRGPVGALDAGPLREAADTEQAAGRRGTALRWLEQGLQLQPDDPWLRHDLARLYLALGLPIPAREVIEEGVQQQPLNEEMVHAAALVATAMDEDDRALVLLDAVDESLLSDAMRRLRTRLAFGHALRQAEQAATREPTGARRWLDEALRLADDQPDRLAEVAQTSARLAEPGLARQIATRLGTTTPATPESRLASARAWLAAGDPPRALEQLHSAAPGDGTAPPSPDWYRQAIAVARRAGLDEIQALLQQGQRPAAVQVAIDLLAADPWSGQPSAGDVSAELLMAAGEPRAAVATLAALPPAQEASARAQRLLLLARAWQVQGDDTAAREAAVQAFNALPASEVEDRLSALRLAAADRNLVRGWMQMLLDQHPQHGSVLLEAARQAERDRNYLLALSHLQRLTAQTAANASASTAPTRAAGVPWLAPRAPGQTSMATLSDDATPNAFDAEDVERARQAVARIQARRQPSVQAAWLASRRRSTPGQSSLVADELPSVVTLPDDAYLGHGFAHVDLVKLDAGTPAAGTADPEFGLGQGPHDAQRAQGVNLAIGWRDDDRRVDLGIVGLGFEASRWAGGWREIGKWEELDVALELSRRPVTSTLLSYAGTTDGGLRWGGISQNALQVSVGHYPGQGWSAAASFKLGVNTGTHVRDNPLAQMRLAADRVWWRQDGWLLNGGLSANAWHYRHNQGFFTYGHGGYYSPQRYLSVGTPWQLTGGWQGWRVDLRASVSYSSTYEADAPYFPLGLSVPGAQPGEHDGGGAGGGWSASLRAALEYPVAPGWHAGVLGSIDRSTSYAPNQLMVYLRRAWGMPTDAPQGTPRPVTPYSQY